MYSKTMNRYSEIQFEKPDLILIFSKWLTSEINAHGFTCLNRKKQLRNQRLVRIGVRQSRLLEPLQKFDPVTKAALVIGGDFPE